MSTVVDTSKLMREIEDDRKSIERRIAEFTKQLEDDLLDKEAAYRYLIKLKDNPFIQAASFSPQENIVNRPLIADIKEAIKTLGDAEFTNADVEKILGREGIRSRITNELTKLVEQGILECAYVGKGRTPSRFKVKNAGHEVKV